MILENIRLKKIIEIKEHLGKLNNVFKFFNLEDPTAGFLLDLQDSTVRSIKGSGEGTVYKLNLIKKILIENQEKIKIKYFEDQTGFYQIENLKKIFNDDITKIFIKDLKINKLELKSLNRFLKAIKKKEEIHTTTIEEFITLSRKNVLEVKSLGVNTLNTINDLRSNLQKYIEQFLNSRFKIFETTKNFEIEKVIIENLNDFIESLDFRSKNIFQERIGYKNIPKTLEEIGQKYKITRERIRQIEAKLYKKFLTYRTIDKDELINYLLNIQNEGFHSNFSKLDDLFVDRPEGSKVNLKNKSIIEDNLIFFLEKYCEVKEGFFTTPEIAAYDIIENINKIKKSFIDLSFPLNHIEICQELNDEFGYSKDILENCLKYIVNENILKIDSEGKYYPYNISIKDEVLIILNRFPDGLHFKEIINEIKKSVSKNHNMIKRSGLDMAAGAEDKLMFSGKGSIRLVKFRNLESINFENIFNIIKNYFNENKIEISDLHIIYDLLKDKIPEKIDIYDFRFIIRNYGKEFGIFFSGKSQASTVSIGKSIRLNIKENILNIHNNSNKHLDIFETIKKIKGTKVLYKDRANELVNEGRLCRFDNTFYCNNKVAYLDIDQKLLLENINKIIEEKEFTADNYISNVMNSKLMMNKSKYFYSSFVKYCLKYKKLDVVYGTDFFTKSKTNFNRLSEILHTICIREKSIEENYKLISRRINISKYNFRIFFQTNYIYDKYYKNYKRN